MNILFVHEIDWLRKVVFEIHTLSELLSLRGHRVYAIDYESMWVKEGLLDFGSLKTRTVTIAGRAYPEASVELIRPGFIKIPGISRLSAACTHYRALDKTIREQNIDVIVLYSVPTNGLQTTRLAKKHRVPLVFRAIDILNQLVPTPALRPITSLMESRVYSSVDLALTISPKLTDYVIRMGAKKGNVSLLPLGVDTREFRPDIDTGEIRKQWGFSKDTPVIVFIGTLFEFSGLDAFIQRFSKITKEVPEARLLIVGDGPQRSELERIISEQNLDTRVIITGFQPYETMPQYINLASICVNPFVITDTTRDIFPTKILQYMACRKPIAATPLPGVVELVPGESEGIVYSDTPDSMIESVISLLLSPERCRELGLAALSYVKQAHSYDKIVRQLEAALVEITGGG